MGKKSARERLIEVAFFLFSEYGYARTTTKDIAKRASVSEVTLFRIFGTKEALFEEVLKRYSVIANLKEVLKEVHGKDLREVLIITARRFYFALLDKKKMVKITLSEINLYSDKVFEIYKRIKDEIDEDLISIFRTKKDELSIDKKNEKLVAMRFRGMIFDLFLSMEIFSVEKVGEKDLENIFENFVDIFLNGIIRKKYL